MLQNCCLFVEELKSEANEGKLKEGSLFSASEGESSCAGGEVEFVKLMIDESLDLKDRVR